ncbi:MAG: hypothetical protein LWW86_11445 [Micrococcales bacterium]|nr:hypothetical protein [Micrococcales bacterium]
MGQGRAVVGMVTAALAGPLTLAALRRLPPSPRERWERTNHAGASITLLEGPAMVGALTAGALAGGGPGALPAAGATLVAGALGALDDLAGDARSKGLKGHLGALVRGEITTGAIKVVGLGVTGVAAAAALDRGARRPLSTLAAGGVIAGTANLVNLLDLRPGRALKAVLVGGALVTATQPDGRSAAPALTAAGAAAGLLAPDLRGESMLGDTGANAAGAALGVALAERCGPLGRGVALATLIGLTLASEKVSFTTVIESTPVLRELDALGRPPRP